MATAEQIAELQALAPTTDLDAATAGDLFDARGLNGALAHLWSQRAAQTATLVDVTESGSSRKMSGIHTNAAAMAARYKQLADDETGVTAVAPSSRTRLISR